MDSAGEKDPAVKTEESSSMLSKDDSVALSKDNGSASLPDSCPSETKPESKLSMLDIVDDKIVEGDSENGATVLTTEKSEPKSSDPLLSTQEVINEANSVLLEPSESSKNEIQNFETGESQDLISSAMSKESTQLTDNNEKDKTTDMDVDLKTESMENILPPTDENKLENNDENSQLSVDSKESKGFTSSLCGNEVEEMEVDDEEKEQKDTDKELGESQEESEGSDESEDGDEEEGDKDGEEGKTEGEGDKPMPKRKRRRRRRRGAFRRVIKRESTPTANSTMHDCPVPTCDFKTRWKHNLIRHKRTHKTQIGFPRVLVEANGNSPISALYDESSNMSTGSLIPKMRRNSTADFSHLSKEGTVERTEDTTPKEHKLYEYQWPLDKSDAEYFVLQEQISEFLGITSFKRKYPGIYRRPVELHERIFLKEQNVVTETQCDLGLTILRSEDVCELMMRDYPKKYEEFCEIMKEREKEKMLQQQKYDMSNMDPADKSKMFFFRKRALKSAVSYNTHIMRELREDRATYFDLQTFEVHHPLKKRKPLPPEATKPSPYPVAVIHGQYSDHYNSYVPEQLNCLPINTVLQKAVKRLPRRKVEEDKGSESDSSDSSSGSSSSSGSGSSSSGSSDSESCAGSDSERQHPEEKEDDGLSSTTKSNGTSSRGGKAFGSRRRGGMRKTPSMASLKKAKIGSTPNSSAPPTPTSKTPVPCYICQEDDPQSAPKYKESMIKCGECSKQGHPSCLELTSEMIPIVKSYSWQCMECKTCMECMQPHDEDKMMFCDQCDRGYHTFCIGLDKIPNGRWECKTCKNSDTPKKYRYKDSSEDGDSAVTSPSSTPSAKRRGRPPKHLAEQLAAERQVKAEEKAAAIQKRKEERLAAKEAREEEKKKRELEPPKKRGRKPKGFKNRSNNVSDKESSKDTEESEEEDLDYKSDANSEKESDRGSEKGSERGSERESDRGSEKGSDRGLEKQSGKKSEKKSEKESEKESERSSGKGLDGDDEMVSDKEELSNTGSSEDLDKETKSSDSKNDQEDPIDKETTDKSTKKIESTDQKLSKTSEQENESKPSKPKESMEDEDEDMDDSEEKDLKASPTETANESEGKNEKQLPGNTAKDEDEKPEPSTPTEEEKQEETGEGNESESPERNSADDLKETEEAAAMIASMDVDS